MYHTEQGRENVVQIIFNFVPTLEASLQYVLISIALKHHGDMGSTSLQWLQLAVFNCIDCITIFTGTKDHKHLCTDVEEYAPL